MELERRGYELEVIGFSHSCQTSDIGLFVKITEPTDAVIKTAVERVKMDQNMIVALVLLYKDGEMVKIV